MQVGGVAVLSAARQVQIPLLSAMLLGGCAAKAHRAVRERSIAAGLSPTAMFPLRLRRPMTIAMCASELGLGVGLLLTAGRAGAGPPATAVRLATALLFLTAVGALHELRDRRPGAGCGCFGEFSDTPVGLRTITRSALLCVAAVAAVGVPPLREPSSSAQAGLLLAVLGAELAVLAALSPEFGEILVRLGYSEPCELRRLPVERTLHTLRASSTWRRYRRQLTAAEPSDVWREGCWRFVMYPGTAAGRRVDVVFAVYMQGRRPPVRAAVLDAATDEVITGGASAAPDQVPDGPPAEPGGLPGLGGIPASPGPSRARESLRPPSSGVPDRPAPWPSVRGAAHHAAGSADSRAARRPVSIAHVVHGHSAGHRPRHSAGF